MNSGFQELLKIDPKEHPFHNSPAAETKCRCYKHNARREAKERLQPMQVAAKVATKLGDIDMLRKLETDMWIWKLMLRNT